MMEPKGGRVIAGKFRLEWPIGRGGMGTVWAAMHLQLDMPVAVKFMDPSAADTDGRIRFEREARAIAQLRSPHVVQVLDHGLENGVPYIVMELLEGEDLESRLRRVRKLPIAAGARIFTQSAKALRKAHDAGIVHRDLKPNNVFLARIDDEEVVKLLDFGVAKMTWSGAQDPHNETTGQGLLLGSPCYMSPEQARGLKDIDYRSDLWSLGVILFRSITGIRPFDANTIADLIIHICTKDPPRASELLPDAPEGIDEFFFRVFQRDPELRYQSALEMANDFESLVRTIPGVVLPPQRTTTSATMSAVGMDNQRSISNPNMPAVVITPERALTNPAMQAVPANLMPPPRDTRVSRPSIPTFDPSLMPAVSYGSNAPGARASHPDLLPPGPSAPAQSAYAQPSAGAAPDESAYADAPHEQEDSAAEEFPADHAEGELEAADPESEDPDAAAQGEGLEGSSSTVRESSAGNRQLLIYTGIAGAVAVLVLILILIVAKVRFGGVVPAAKPSETAVAGDTATAMPTPPPPAPSAADTGGASSGPSAAPALSGTAQPSAPLPNAPFSPDRTGPAPAFPPTAPSNTLHPAGSSSGKKPKPNFGY